MKRVVITLLFSCIVSMLPVAGANDKNAKVHRILPETCTYRVSLESVLGTGKTHVSTLRGYKSGDEKNVLIVETPPKAKGTVILQKDDAVFCYVAKKKETANVSPHERLRKKSILSYDDLLLSEFFASHTVVESEEKKHALHITLEPKGKAEYASVVVRVRKNLGIPVRRDYFNEAGDVVKTARVVALKQRGGAVKYIKIKFSEPGEKRFAYVTYSGITEVAESDLPKHLFNEKKMDEIGKE